MGWRGVPWLALVLATLLGIPPAEAARITAPDCAGQDLPGPAGVLACRFAPASGYRPNHEGGPWLNVDLLHVPLAELRKLVARTSGKTVFAGGPLIPKLALVHAQVCLSDPTVLYSDCPNDYPHNPGNAGLGYRLNPKLVPLLQQGLDRLRQAGLKVILRFTYNWPCLDPDASGCEGGRDHDAPIGVILQHMRQLAPTIQKNRDVIKTLQAGFIGRWGEWHNSTFQDNGSPATHNRFLDEYTRLFDGVVGLEVRTPYVLLDYNRHRFGQGTPLRVRELGIGLHDDAFGEGATDAGTFLPEQPVNTPDPAFYKLCDLKRAALAMSHYFTMTAEATGIYDGRKRHQCAALPDPPDALGYAAAYSLSSFQLGFRPAVMRNWVSTGIFDEIVRTTGPHLLLVDSQLWIGGAQDDKLFVKLRLKNRGWAGISRSRGLTLVLRRDGGPTLTFPLDVDLRWVRAGQTLPVARQIRLGRDLPPGRYQAFLQAADPAPRLADDPRYALLFENQAVPDERTGLNRLGAFTLAE